MAPWHSSTVMSSQRHRKFLWVVMRRLRRPPTNHEPHEVHETPQSRRFHGFRGLRGWSVGGSPQDLQVLRRGRGGKGAVDAAHGGVGAFQARGERAVGAETELAAGLLEQLDARRAREVGDYAVAHEPGTAHLRLVEVAGAGGVGDGARREDADALGLEGVAEALRKLLAVDDDAAAGKDAVLAKQALRTAQAQDAGQVVVGERRPRVVPPRRDEDAPGRDLPEVLAQLGAAHQARGAAAVLLVEAEAERGGPRLDAARQRLRQLARAVLERVPAGRAAQRVQLVNEQDSAGGGVGALQPQAAGADDELVHLQGVTA